LTYIKMASHTRIYNVVISSQNIQIVILLASSFVDNRHVVDYHIPVVMPLALYLLGVSLCNDMSF
jgi:hypothetical protein